MKKKWFVGIVTILMFVLCAIGLAACGEKGGSTDGLEPSESTNSPFNPDTPSVERVTITYYSIWV